MTLRYAVDCLHCQKANEVEARQAGQSIACSGCGKPIDIPTLRQMRQVVASPLTKDQGSIKGASTARIRSSTEPNYRRNVLFSMGIGLMLLGLAAGLALFFYSGTMMIGGEVDNLVAEFNEPVNSFNALQLWENWDGIREDPALPVWEQSEWQTTVQNGQILRLVAWAFLALGSGGLLLVVVAFFSGKPRSSSR